MRAVSRICTWPALAWLACTAQLAAADTAAATFVPVARSALITLQAAPAAAGVKLRAEAAGAAAPLKVNALTLSIDGHSVPVSAQADGSWSAPWPAGAAAGARRFEAVLSHDGIRELLSGTLPAAPRPAAASGAAGLLGDHKQLAWWVLNLAVVLIAVLAISRRMS